jgi:hypothetical protein
MIWSTVIAGGLDGIGSFPHLEGTVGQERIE